MVLDLITLAYYAYMEKYIYINSMIPRSVYHVFNTLFFITLAIGAIVSLGYLFMTFNTILTKDNKIKQEEKISKKTKLPFVTIQIPTKNEIIALRCAKKCINFNYPNNRYEIIIGDDSTKENISKKIDKFVTKYKKKFPNLKITRRPDKSGYKPGNLNYMLKYSKGEIIIIFDSDFAPGKDFLKRIIVPFKDKNVSGVQARWKFSNADKNIITALGATIVYTFHHVALIFLKKQKMGFLCGSAEAVRKKDLIRLGGWKHGSLTEDIEYSLRLYKKRKKIHYLPGLECYNEAPSRPFDLYRQQMRWAYGVISSYKAHTKDILNSKIIPRKQKLFTMVGSFGYILPIVILFIFLFGGLTFFTKPVSPIDWNETFYEITRNIALTGGLLVASTFALVKAKKTKLIPKAFFSSFTIGLVTTFFVNKGIVKALFNSPMKWYLLKKSEKIS